MAQITQSHLSHSSKPIFLDDEHSVKDQVSQIPILDLPKKVEIVFKGGVPKNLIDGYTGYGLLGQ